MLLHVLTWWYEIFQCDPLRKSFYFDIKVGAAASQSDLSMYGLRICGNVLLTGSDRHLDTRILLRHLTAATSAGHDLENPATQDPDYELGIPTQH